MNSGNTFTKAERISSQKEIDLLFDKGNAFIAYPLRIIYMQQQPFSGAPVAILTSVPKKRFKRAVKRNRIKRLMREAFRLNKHALWDFLQSKETGLLLALVYVGNELCDFETMEAAVRKTIHHLTQKLA